MRKHLKKQITIYRFTINFQLLPPKQKQKNNKNKQKTKTQSERYEGPNGTDYRPGNTHDRLTADPFGAQKVKQCWDFLFCVVLFQFNCSSDDKKKDKVFVIATYDDVKDWDPATAFSLEIFPMSNMYEPLLWYDAGVKPGRFVPGLATSYSKSQDGLVWVFNLRKNVFFHDGTKFDAEAVKFVVERNKKLNGGASYIWSSVSKIIINSPHQITFTLSSPVPFDKIVSSQYGAWMYSPAIDSISKDSLNHGFGSGTGPYQLKKWARNKYILLDKFDTILDTGSTLVDAHLVPFNTTRVIHYPAYEGKLEQKQMRIGEHSDYGTITLLWQINDVPGLEVQDLQGRWHAVPYANEGVVVNIGDLLQRWTNDYFKSTKHRVVNTHIHQERFSMPHFVDPTPGTIVWNLRDEPSKYDPIESKEYLMWRLAQSY